MKNEHGTELGERFYHDLGGFRLFLNDIKIHKYHNPQNKFLQTYPTKC